MGLADREGTKRRMPVLQNGERKNYTKALQISVLKLINKYTSWDELISPRLRQLARARLTATEALQANKLIVLLNLLEDIFIYFFLLHILLWFHFQ